MSWSDTTTSVAMTAENKPFYIAHDKLAHSSVESDPVRTKIMIPSASFCQRSAIILSIFSARLEYIAKRGPELSPWVVPSCDRLITYRQRLEAFYYKGW